MKLKRLTNEKNSKNLDLIAYFIIGLGVIGVFVVPFILKQPALVYDLSNTESLAISISGLTAPVIGLMSAILIYISFKAQINMNKRQWEEIQQNSLQRDLEFIKELGGLFAERVLNSTSAKIFAGSLKAGHMRELLKNQQPENWREEAILLYEKDVKGRFAYTFKICEFLFVVEEQINKGKLKSIHLSLLFLNFYDALNVFERASKDYISAIPKNILEDEFLGLKKDIERFERLNSVIDLMRRQELKEG